MRENEIAHTNVCRVVGITDLFTYTNLSDDRFREWRGLILPFHMDFRRCPYNTLAQLYECDVHRVC